MSHGAKTGPPAPGKLQRELMCSITARAGVDARELAEVVHLSSRTRHGAACVRAAPSTARQLTSTREVTAAPDAWSAADAARFSEKRRNGARKAQLISEPRRKSASW